MNENKNNEEIEVLDGLEDFFELTPNKTVQKEPEKVEKIEEEVFSVFDESDEGNFSTFEPDQIEEDTSFEDLTPMDLKPTIEPMVEPEVFSMDEPVEMDEEDHFKIEEEVPDVVSFNPESLAPIELASSLVSENPTDEMFQWNVEEPLETEMEMSSTEMPNVDMNYNFMEEFAPQERSNLEDAFQFEPTKVVEETLELSDETMDSDALGKTVVIEPVEPKEMQEVPKEEPASLEPEIAKEVPKEQQKKTKKKKNNKGNGRTILFIILLGILLLAFVALIPILLETFAI